jgi:hypothetical protein
MVSHGVAGETPSASRLRLMALAAGLALTLSSAASAQVSGRFPDILPDATIISNETDTAPEDEAPPSQTVPPVETVAPPTHPPHRRHHTSVANQAASTVAESTHAMLKLKKDLGADAHWATANLTLERVRTGKSIDLPGSSRHYVRVKLKNRATGHVPISVAEVVRPTDRILRLSTDAAVVSEPNRDGEKLSEVHRGHDVHAIGVSVDYIKVRMKSGLEGFIPMTAAE